jgi:hypothetical protein
MSNIVSVSGISLVRQWGCVQAEVYDDYSDG